MAEIINQMQIKSAAIRNHCQRAAMGIWLYILRLILKIFVRYKVLNTPDLRAHPNSSYWYVLRSRSWIEALILKKYCISANLPAPNFLTGLKTDQEAPSHETTEQTNALGPPVLYLHQRGFRQLITNATRSAKERKQSDSPHLTWGTDPVVRDQIFKYERTPDLIPVSIFWGRAPDRSNSIWKLLFSESWQKPSALKKAFRVLWHGRECNISFGAPITLDTSLETSESTKQKSRICRKLFRLCRIHFRQERTAAIGPDLSHRRQITQAVLSRQKVREAIALTAKETNTPSKVIKRQAYSYAMEIASDYAHAMIRASHLILSRLWHRLYDGLNVHGLEAVHAIAGTHTLIYVPCHRSHLDYLLLPFILYNAGLAPPHTAAGINLNLPLIGRFLRHGGAFFLRRQFKGNPLYTQVFEGYLSEMLDRGFSLAFFIEGGRSRSGRLLAPKLGMINMIVKNYSTPLNNNQSKPVAIVPIYIGYEKLFEGNTYLKELSGAQKRPESISGLIRALRGIRHNFGQVHIQFAPPLPLADTIHTTASPNTPPSTPHNNHPIDSAPKIEGDALRTQVECLGHKISHAINAAAIVADMNLISLAILAAPRHALDESVLRNQLAFYQMLLQATEQNTHWIVSTNTPEIMIERAEALGLLQRQNLFSGDILLAPPNKAMLLTYIKNNCLHTLCAPAVLACALVKTHPEVPVDPIQLTHTLNIILPMLCRELNFTWCVETSKEYTQSTLSFLQTQDIIRSAQHALPLATELPQIQAAPKDSSQGLRIKLLSAIIRPTLERYLVTLSFLKLKHTTFTDKQSLLGKLQENVQRLAVLAEFNAPEFFEQKLIEALIAGMEALNWIRWQPHPQAESRGVSHMSIQLTPAGHTAYEQLKNLVGAGVIPLLNLND